MISSCDSLRPARFPVLVCRPNRNQATTRCNTLLARLVTWPFPGFYQRYRSVSLRSKRRALRSDNSLRPRVSRGYTSIREPIASSFKIVFNLSAPIQRGSLPLRIRCWPQRARSKMLSFLARKIKELTPLDGFHAKRDGFFLQLRFIRGADFRWFVVVLEQMAAFVFAQVGAPEMADVAQPAAQRKMAGRLLTASRPGPIRSAPAPRTYAGAV